MRHRLQQFIDGVQRRTARLADCGALLVALTPGLQAAATALGAPAQLDPLISALHQASLARTQEKAHHDLLLALQTVA
jgi:hypothetical protein